MKVDDTQNKKKSNKVIIMISIILVLLILAIICYLVIQDIRSKQTSIQESETEKIEESQEKYSLIDMENTENAKIENGRKENTSGELAKEKNINGIKISDSKLVAQNGIVTFKAIATNASEEKFTAKTITIVFLDKEGKEFARLNGYLGDIEVNGEASISASTSDDVTNAFDYTIEFGE